MEKTKVKAVITKGFLLLLRRRLTYTIIAVVYIWIYIW